MPLWTFTQFDKDEEIGSTDLVLAFTPAAGHKAIAKQLAITAFNNEAGNATLTLTVSVGGVTILELQYVLATAESVLFTLDPVAVVDTNTKFSGVVPLGLGEFIAEASEAITITLDSGADDVDKWGSFSGLDETT